MLLRMEITLISNNQIALIAGALTLGPIIAIIVWMWYSEIKEWIDKR
jgi:hypothetical protein